MKKILLLLLIATPSFAIGILTFKSTVESMDEKTVTLKLADSSKIRVPKSSLTKEQLANLKPNGSVTLAMDEREIKKAKVKK